MGLKRAASGREPLPLPQPPMQGPSVAWEEGAGGQAACSHDTICAASMKGEQAEGTHAHGASAIMTLDPSRELRVVRGGAR
jgi:hypothetical protein